MAATQPSPYLPGATAHDRKPGLNNLEDSSSMAQNMQRQRDSIADNREDGEIASDVPLQPPSSPPLYPSPEPHLTKTLNRDKHPNGHIDESSKNLQQTSPIAHLPTEILAEIFQAAINPDTATFLGPKEPATDRQHFKTLRAVCKQWRSVAFATHSLWTTVFIDFDQYTVHEVPRVIEGVRHYFNQSGPTLPLNVGFQWRDDTAYSHLYAADMELLPKDMNTVMAWELWMDLLFDYRARWEEVSFFTMTAHFQVFERRLRKSLENGLDDAAKWNTLFFQLALDEPTVFYATPPGSGTDVTDLFSKAFPNLETINLDTRSDTLLVEGPDTQLLTPHPNLRKLRLEVYRDFNTYFSKLGGGFPRLKKLLFACPNLDVTPVWEDGPTFELPELEILVISCPPSFSMLSRLRTPALKTLQLMTYVPPAPCLNEYIVQLQKQLAGSFHHVVAFARQCNTTLREFRMNSWFLEDEGLLRRLFEGLGSVELVCIDTWFQSPGMLDGVGDVGAFGTLEIRDVVDELQNSMYLPNLRRLCLHHTDDDEIPAADLPEDSPVSSTTASATGVAADVNAPTFPGQDSAPPPTEEDVALHQAPSLELPPLHSQENVQDSDQHFLRGSYSWPSLGSFVSTAAQRRGAWNDGKKFTFCVSAKANREGGEEARQVLGSLENAGVCVRREPVCKVYW